MMDKAEEEFRKNREEFTVELRKEHREDRFSKRRGRAQNPSAMEAENGEGAKRTIVLEE
jgi:hypothetical protein